MPDRNFALTMWRRLSDRPLGKWLFSRLVCFKAPYFATISPTFAVLEPGKAVVTLKKKRKVQNHLGTVHAIAMCNMAELAAGTMTDVTVPAGYRWIPKGMTVRYLAKAETDLRAVAEVDAALQLSGATDLVVPVKVHDSDDTVVFEADITMYVSPKRQPVDEQSRPAA